jgi:hypothetical protein
VVGSLLVGFLQAWDSHALQAGTFAQALILAGIVAPAATIAATGSAGARIAALAAGAVLFAWARIITPISLNALHIALFVPAMYILFVSRWIGARRERTT